MAGGGPILQVQASSTGTLMAARFLFTTTHGRRPKLLRSLLMDIGWSEEDLRRLKLVR